MSSGPQLPSNPTPAYQYQNQPTADAGAISGTQNLPNYAQQNYPSFQNVAGQVTSGAYGAPQIQGAGNSAINSGQTATGAASPLIGAGQGALGAGQSLVPYATQALQTGFDPQGQNYNAQFALQNQQGGVNNAANGVAGTPYGAGVQNQGDQNFNLTWQQQQLARQQAGAGTATSLLGQGNQDINTGANALTGAGGLLATGGQLGQTGAGLLAGVPNESLSALSSLNQAGGQATGVNQQMIQDFLSYLGGGTGAANAATGQYGAESNASIGQYNAAMSPLSGLGSALPGLIGSTSATGGSGLIGLSSLLAL